MSGSNVDATFTFLRFELPRRLLGIHFSSVLDSIFIKGRHYLIVIFEYSHLIIYF